MSHLEDLRKAFSIQAIATLPTNNIDESLREHRFSYVPGIVPGCTPIASVPFLHRGFIPAYTNN